MHYVFFFLYKATERKKNDCCNVSSIKRNTVALCTSLVASVYILKTSWTKNKGLNKFFSFTRTLWFNEVPVNQWSEFCLILCNLQLRYFGWTVWRSRDISLSRAPIKVQSRHCPYTGLCVRSSLCVGNWIILMKLWTSGEVLTEIFLLTFS